MLPSIILRCLPLCFTIYLPNHGKREHFRKVFCVLYVRRVLSAGNSLTRHALNRRLERMSFRDDAIVLVLGTLNNERHRLRYES